MTKQQAQSKIRDWIDNLVEQIVAHDPQYPWNYNQTPNSTKVMLARCIQNVLYQLDKKEKKFAIDYEAYRLAVVGAQHPEGGYWITILLNNPTFPTLSSIPLHLKNAKAQLRSEAE